MKHRPPSVKSGRLDLRDPDENSQPNNHHLCSPYVMSRRPSLCSCSPNRGLLSSSRKNSENIRLSVNGDSVFTLDTSFPVLISYEHIIGSIMESIRMGYVNIDDFERAVEAMKFHYVKSPSTSCPRTNSINEEHAITKSRSYTEPTFENSMEFDDKFKNIVPQSTTTDSSKSHIRLFQGLDQTSLKAADIVLGELLGSGSMGSVYKGMLKKTCEYVAVKVIELSSDAEELENELNVLQSLSHRSIVRYLGHEKLEISSLVQYPNLPDRTHPKLLIFCEYMPGHSLCKALKQFGSFTESTTRLFATQIIDGLDYLHHNRICHRDLKGENILLSIDGTCKLSDFGCSKQLDAVTLENSIMKTVKGSVPWMAPEVMLGEGYGRQADIWAFGCVLVEMLTGSPPWGKLDNIVHAMYKIAMSEESPHIPDHISDVLQDIIGTCVSRDPKHRFTARELKELTYFSV